MDRLGNFLVNFFFGSWERTRGTLIFIGILVSIYWVLNNQGSIINFFNQILRFFYDVVLPFAFWLGLALLFLSMGFSFITKPFRSGKKK